MKTTFARRQLLKLLTAACLGAPFATCVIADEADKNAPRAVKPENTVARNPGITVVAISCDQSAHNDARPMR